MNGSTSSRIRRTQSYGWDLHKAREVLSLNGSMLIGSVSTASLRQFLVRHLLMFRGDFRFGGSFPVGQKDQDDQRRATHDDRPHGDRQVHTAHESVAGNGGELTA